MNITPSIDHSLLSPSGHMSKRARKAAMERERRRLFGDGLPPPTAGQPTRANALRRQEERLRALASRGMKTRAYLREADRIREQIEEKGATP